MANWAVCVFRLTLYKSKTMKKIFLLLIALVAVSTLQAQLQGVLFSEYRMILNNNNIASLQLNNPTQETRTYSLSFVDKKFDKDGVIINIPDSVKAEYSLKPYLRVFPRTITLNPGESQEIQIQLKAPASVPDGEYRSYLHFLPLEKSTPSDSIKVSGVQLDIKFRIGAALPLFYRKNTVLTQVDIDNVNLTKRDSITMLNFDINREGTRSTYGYIVVSGMSQGKPLVVMETPGNALYSEQSSRKVEMPISLERIDRTPDGKVLLTITYYNSEDKTNLKNNKYVAKTVEIMPPK